MAEKQYADKSFMAEYSSYLKENALDPISRVIEIDGNASVAALHLPPQCDDPYFVMTSADNTKSIQVMTNGAWGGNDADGTGMGIRFFSSDGQNTKQGYGNIALKADPRHGWDYVLTLPNETGTLATRNYVDDSLDDRLSFSSTPLSTSQVVFQTNGDLRSNSSYTFSSLGLAALKGDLSVNAEVGKTAYAELKDAQGARTVVASKQSSVLLYVEEADVGVGQNGEDVRLVITSATKPDGISSDFYVSLGVGTYWIQLFGSGNNGLARIYRMPANGGSWSFVKSIEYNISANFFLLCVGGPVRSGSPASATAHFIAS